MPRYEPFDWYEQPLYYDLIFDDGTDQEAAFLEAAFHRYADSGGRDVLEPACGSGRLMAALGRRGLRVVGFDINEAMLAFARRRLREQGIRGRLVKARMEDFTFPRRFDLAHCLVSTFKYLPDEASARAHLKCVAEALKPGGLYVLGLHLTDYSDRRRNRERWVVQSDGLEVTCNIQGWPADRRNRTEHVRCRLIVQEKGEERRYETNWTFRSYSVRELKSLLNSAPALEHVTTFNFTYDIDKPIRFDGSYLDNVLVLRKTS